MKKNLIFLILFVQTTFAQWNPNDKNPVVLSAAKGKQETTAFSTDTEGNSYYAWADGRDNVIDIYAQKLDARGKVLWAKDGVFIGRIADKIEGFFSNKVIKPDSKGGAIIVWQRLLDVNNNSRQTQYTQYVAADGKTQWTNGGIRLFQQEQNVADPYYDIIDVYDQKDKLLYIYNVYNSSNFNVIYTKKLDFAGNTVEAEKKLFEMNGFKAKVAFDEANNRFVSVRVKDANDYLFQAFDATNKLLPNVYDINNPFDGSSRIDYFRTDRDGNVFIGRTFTGGGKVLVYAEKINKDLSRGWNVRMGSESAFDIQIAPTSDGGGILSWAELNDKQNPYKVSKVNIKGETLWEKRIFNPTSDRGYFIPNKLAPSGNDGAYALWFTPSSPNFDLSVQHIDKDGNLKYGDAGYIFRGYDFFTDYRPITYPNAKQGGIIVMFGAVKNNEADLYTNYIAENGTLGLANSLIINNLSTNETCAGTSFSVNVNSTTTYNADNNFRVLISDRNGNFDANSVEIGRDSKTPIQVKTPPSLTVGTYKIKVVSTSPAIESQNLGEIKIIETSPPSISADKTTICAGDKITLTAQGCNGTVRWSNGSSGSSFSINPIDNITFSAFCNVAGCTESRNSNPVEIKANKVVATASNSGPYLEGDEIKLSSSGGSAYAWTGPNSYVSATQNPIIPQARVAMSGVYSVKVTDANNCSATAQTSVVVNPILSNEKPSELSIRVFPNPSNQQLSVQFQALPNEEISLTIVDFRGKNIFKKNLKGKGGFQTEIIDIQGVSPGMYLIKVKDKVSKLMIEN